MACMQVKQGKKQEAASNLAKGVGERKDGSQLQYVVNDLKILELFWMRMLLQPALKRLKETSDYLYI